MKSNFDFDPENESKMSKLEKIGQNSIQGDIDTMIRFPLLMKNKQEWFDMIDKKWKA